MSKRCLVPTLAVAVVACVLLSSATARADVAKCGAAISNGSAAFVQAEAKALQRCEDVKLKGKLPPATECRTEAKAAAAIAKAAAKLTSGIAKACGGEDKLCGGANGADDQSLASIGWDLGTCPNFEDGSCDNAIADCTDVATCLSCIADHAVTQAIATSYAALQPTTSADKELRKCQVAIGKAASRYLEARAKSFARCWSIVHKAGAGPCPDATTIIALHKAEQQKVDAITSACGGKDRTAGTADDLTPAQIGFPASCPGVTRPGEESCARPVTTLPDLIECVDCVGAFASDCADRAAVPVFASPYPAECNVALFAGPDCPAQRTVHVVAGIGSLAWFTLVWPAPRW